MTGQGARGSVCQKRIASPTLVRSHSSKQENKLSLSIAGKILGSERRSRENGWSYIGRLTGHLGKWPAKEIAVVTIPDYQTLMLPVLRLAAEREQRVADVVDRVADEFGLSAKERQTMLASGRQRVLHNRIHWAKFYMTKAGLLASPGRGRFAATQVGRDILAAKPGRVDVALLLKQSSFREFYRNNGSSGSGVPDATTSNVALKTETTTPEEQIEAAYQALQAGLRADLLDRIAKNSPGFFEQLIIDLLVAMGYGGNHRSAATQLGRSGDGGVDGVVNEDRLGLDRLYV